MNCPRCGQLVAEGAPFCGNCGAPLSPQVAVAAVPMMSPALKRILIIGGALLAILFCIICNFIFVIMEVSSPIALVLSTIAAIIPAIFYSGLVVQLDRYEREPALVLLGAFLWGALVATAFSYVMNTLFGIIVSAILGPETGMTLTAGISAPIMEETSKGAALLLLFLFMRHEFDNVLDGIVYGSLVGIGFAMTENIAYFGRAYMQGELLGLAALFYIRAILGGLGHAAYTACTGAGFGFARESNFWLWKITAPIVGLIAAMFLHSSWNFIAGSLLPSLLGGIPDILYLIFIAPLESLILTGPAVLALLALAFFTWRREARIISQQLQDEMTAGVITPEEYSRLSSSRARVRAEWRALVDRGIGGWYALTQLHQAATELAFRKWHLSRGEAPKRAQKTTPEDEYRRRIMELRARL